MYDVLDICRYIINYSNENFCGISNLKLQKILYFIQAHFLTTNEGTPCFSDDIVAWDFGPVVPSAYHEYKQFGAANIPPIDFYIEIGSNSIWESKKKKFDDSFIVKQDKEKINYILILFASYSATSLVELTHKQSPWINAHKTGMNCIILKKSIKEYFK